MRSLGVVTVVSFLFLFFFLVFFFYRFQLNRVDGDDFEVAAALGAGNDLAFIDIIFLDVEISFAFWTKNHDCLSLDSGPHLLIFSFSEARGQVAGRPRFLAVLALSLDKICIVSEFAQC